MRNVAYGKCPPASISVLSGMTQSSGLGRIPGEEEN